MNLRGLNFPGRIFSARIYPSCGPGIVVLRTTACRQTSASSGAQVERQNGSAGDDSGLARGGRQSPFRGNRVRKVQDVAVTVREAASSKACGFTSTENLLLLQALESQAFLEANRIILHRKDDYPKLGSAGTGTRHHGRADRRGHTVQEQMGFQCCLLRFCSPCHGPHQILSFVDLKEADFSSIAK